MRKTSRLRTAAVVAGLVAITACADAPFDPLFTDPGAEGAKWGAWVLETPNELRPSSPGQVGAAELETVIRLQSERTPADNELISRWDRPPTGPWTELAMDLVDRYIMTLPRNHVATPTRASRAAALMHVAMYDALVASWDAKFAYERDVPYRADGRIEHLATSEAAYGYPSGHAAASAAAAAVLAYAFPDEDRDRFEAMAEEAGHAHVLAGLAFPSDVEAGLELGRQVAERVLARARGDGAHLEWDGRYPEGEHVWQPTPPRMTRPPYDPLAGAWLPWVMERQDQFRSPPPPEIGSPEFEADMDELRRMPGEVTEEQVLAALYWATSAPSMRWHLYMEEALIARNVPVLHAAWAHALNSVAMYDAFVACWEAKYYFWLLRPISVDPEIETLFPTPPFPAYPSGHSTISMAAAEIFADLFPEEAARYREKAETAAESRVWGGVHYRFDSVAGKEQGASVGRLVAEQGRRMIGW